MKQKIDSLLNKLTFPYVVTLLATIAFIVFGNILFNNFVEDDKNYIINEPVIHQINLPMLFGINNFNNAGQYRPLSATYFSLLYQLFGTNSFFYHFLQILLHITVTSFIYILFRKFISPGIALFLALVFLVHPINVESVSYIAQSVSPLFFLFGIVAFYLLSSKKASSKMFIIAFFLFFLSLLTKETGILFILLLLLYNFLFARKQNMALVVGLFLLFIVYAFFRFSIGHVGLETRTLAPIAELTFIERLFTIPAIMFYYLKTFFYPSVLTINQQWVVTSINFTTFYFPLLMDFLFIVILSLGGLYIFKNHKQQGKPFVFFYAWFFLGLFMHLQIFPLDKTVADRWFYFPMVGLLGMLGIFYQAFPTRLKHILISLVLSILIILLLSYRTIIRNSDWQNAQNLYMHDLQYNNSFDLHNNLGVEYANNKEYSKALAQYEKSVALRPYELNLLNIAVTHQNMDSEEKAKIYYEKALKAKDYKLFGSHRHDLNLYKGYASLLVFFYNDSVTAVPFIKDALMDYPDVADLWFLLALAQYKQNEMQDALHAAEKAYQLNPQNLYIYTQILNNQPVIIDLNEKTFTITPK